MLAFPRTAVIGVVALLAFVPASVLAAPAMSRGEQRLSIGYEECMRRAEAALAREGYSAGQRGGAYIHGTKGIHGAYIMCNVAGDGTTWVNIVVASNNASDGNVPGKERVNLQKRMDEASSSSAPPATAASPTGTVNVTSVGGWTSVWTRRGTSNTWDAIWKNGSRTETTVMEGGFRGNQADFKRTYSSDGYLCSYTGTIAADGKTVSGTQKCPGISDYPWQGTFATGGGAPATGTAMSGTKLDVSCAGWTAVFSTRGNGNVWDGIWTQGSRRETTVMEGGFRGNELYLKRTSSSDGHLCEYHGTVSADGGTVSGTQKCPGIQDYAFTATITNWMR